MTPEERAGLKLFLGKGQCATCHTGPLLSDGAFHNIRLPSGNPDAESGRSTALAEVLADPFNCLGRFSDADASDCAEVQFIAVDDPKFLALSERLRCAAFRNAHPSCTLGSSRRSRRSSPITMGRRRPWSGRAN